MPNTIIRMIQFGLKKKALSCSTIWLCVGCNTCSMECPNGVDVAAVMDGLRQMAIQEKIPAAEPGILSFHNAVIDSIARYGRTHKLEIMMRYKLASKDLFSDIDLGFKMMSRRKLDLIPSKVRDIVIACAMCHLNLEIRCLPENRIPIFHFSELLSLALEGKFSRSWLKRHLIDPAPLLEKKQLINSRDGRASADKAKATAQHP